MSDGFFNTGGMNMYRQMTRADRLKMETLLNAGHNKAYVASYLHFSRATITREYQKGAYMHLNSDLTYSERYSCDLAQQRHDYAQTAKGKQLKIQDDYKLVAYLEQKIGVENYSPEAALAEIKTKGLKFKMSISVKTLYRYIDGGLFLNISNNNLPVVGKRSKRRKTVRKVQKKASAGQSIEKRDGSINERVRFGDWEMDTVKGKQGVTKSCLLVLTERVTRWELIFKLPDGKAQSVVDVLDTLERRFEMQSVGSFSRIFKTITVDNGVEFSDYDGLRMSRLHEHTERTRLYYCHAYSSYERGSNENQNRMIRRKIIKGSDIDKYSDEYIREVARWLNNYPRRIFNYLSSM